MSKGNLLLCGFIVLLILGEVGEYRRLCISHATLKHIVIGGGMSKPPLLTSSHCHDNIHNLIYHTAWVIKSSVNFLGQIYSFNSRFSRMGMKTYHDLLRLNVRP